MSATTEALLRRDSVLLLWELRALWVTTALYLASSFLYLLWLLLPGSGMGKTASRLFRAGAVIHSAIIVIRVVEGGRLPYQTLYESLLWFGWSAAITYLLVKGRFPGVFAAGFPIAGIVGAACLSAMLGCDPGMAPVSPAHQSDWFFWHVVITFVSYAVFAVAFSVELGYVVLTRVRSPETLPAYNMDATVTARFHRVAHQLVLFGFPLLTFGIVAGAAWAGQAWGRYWSWDSRETWSLITWTVYVLYLHSMTRAKWRGGRASALNIAGFVCVLMRFLGSGWIAKLLGISGLGAY